MTAEPAVRPATLRGASVAGFVLEARLGGGGGGAVWRARGAGGDAVAVKLLHAPLASEEARRRFARERETLERLASHPAIVPLVASGVDADGTGWLATPLYAASLAERLASVGTLAAEETVRIGVRLAGALENAHARGVVHGDVKPANVLLDAEGRAVLGDFGASVLEDATLTRACALSFDWAAPERLGGAPPSVASDLFGLGLTLKRALRGGDPDAKAPDASDSPALDALIDDLTRADPHERPASAADVRGRLAALLPDDVDASGACPSSRSGGVASPAASATGATSDTFADTARTAVGSTSTDAAVRLAPPDAVRRSAAGGPRPSLVLVTLGGAALAVGFALGRERPPLVEPVAATLDCPPGAYLCERFDDDRGDWVEGGNPDVARFTIAPRPDGFGSDGALVRTAGSSAARGGANISHPIAAPPPGSTLRVRARLAIARDTADAPDIWLHLLQLEAANGQVWSVSVGGYGTSGMTFDGRYHDAGGPNDATFESGIPRRVDAPLCLEAIVRPSAAEDAPELAVYVDGTFVGALEHPPRRDLRAWADRFDVYLGGPGVDPPRDAPEIVFDEVVIDSAEVPGCLDMTRGDGEFRADRIAKHPG